MGMTNNGKCKIMGNVKWWEMTINGKWQTKGIDK